MVTVQSPAGQATAPPRAASWWSELAKLFGARPGAVATLAAVSVVSGLTESGILAVVAQVATSLVSGTKPVSTSFGGIHVSTTVGGLLIVAGALSAIRVVLQIPLATIPARISAQVQARLRRGMFGAFTRASWEVQAQDREGDLQELLTNQVYQASNGAIQATTLVVALISFLILIASAFALNVGAAIVVVGTAVVLFALLRPLNMMAGRRAQHSSAAQMNFANGVGEATRLAQDTQVFGAGQAQRERVDRLTDVAQRLSFETQLLARMVPSLYQSMIYCLLVGGLAVIYETQAGHIASLGGVVLLLVRAGTYGQQLQGAHLFVRQSLPFLHRLSDAEARYADSEPKRGSRPLAAVERLRFEHVSYAYVPGRPVLADIDFRIRRGEAIGIVGPSGAGKSTLVQLLLLLREPQRGRYTVNGQVAQEFRAPDWHRLFAYVPQEPRLLHASVADNIRYYRDIDELAVERAAKLACIHDDVMGWPLGYDTLIGPRADAVSGGQQQRICLARALVARPEVLVLDEPTSALDPRSEALLQESLIGLKGAVTLFIVAHRMTTLAMCDRVMVIVDGRLEAFDTSATLRTTSPYYRNATTLTARSTQAAIEV